MMPPIAVKALLVTVSVLLAPASVTEPLNNRFLLPANVIEALLRVTAFGSPSPLARVVSNVPLVSVRDAVFNAVVLPTTRAPPLSAVAPL